MRPRPRMRLLRRAGRRTFWTSETYSLRGGWEVTARFVNGAFFSWRRLTSGLRCRVGLSN